MSAARYQVIPGSQSCHCCFDYTVIDTTRPSWFDERPGRGQKYVEVCECFEKEDADRIAAALNATEPTP